MTRRRRPWQVEESGVRLRVFLNGGRYWVDVRTEHGRKRHTLDTIDKATAESRARALAKQLATHRLTGIQPDTVTLGQLFAWYREAAGAILNKKDRPVSVAWQQAAAARMALFTTEWGADLPVVAIDQPRVDAYVARRLAGDLSPLTPKDAEHGRQPRAVRARTVDADLVWLKSAINYGRKKRDRNGQPLLRTNPLDGITWPREKNVQRPRASAARYAATLPETDAVDPAGRLRCVLALARFTGHRVSAILALWASDLLLTEEAVARGLESVGQSSDDATHLPHGAILWRAVNDKQGVASVTALSRAAREEVDRYRRGAARVGDVPLFPAPLNDAAPLGRRLASRWLLKAEKRAKLEKLPGGIWHPYRRAWATERKAMPDVDVAATGGWTGTRAMKLCYQQADAATMLRVAEGV